MVARIRSGKSIKGAINYNERKVKLGTAVIIMANGYGKEPDKLAFSQKINRLQRLADLNTRVGTHCLHISLNFDPKEHLSRQTLGEIAKDYMEGIGFGQQPFLVYEHSDAAHQHIHIVSTNIDRKGKRISLHNIGKGKSETARKLIENKFGLLKAGGRVNLENYQIKPILMEKASYGQAPTKRAISNIVLTVVDQYKFASLAELNAVLKQYNVVADRGGKDTRMFQKGGLCYSITDNLGNKVGVPVKASSIHSKPNLRILELRFEANKLRKLPFKKRLTDCIEKSIEDCRDLKLFSDSLEKAGVNVVYRISSTGFVYGITYVDNISKTVFNGSELGKSFSAVGIIDRIEANRKLMQVSGQGNTIFRNEPSKQSAQPNTDNQERSSRTTTAMFPYVFPVSKNNLIDQLADTSQLNIMGELLEPAGISEWLPWALRRKFKKRAKKR